LFSCTKNPQVDHENFIVACLFGICHRLRDGPLQGAAASNFVSDGQESALGDDAYRDILRDSVITHDVEAERIVRQVGERIANAANNPNTSGEWA
jgi:predicted Zn-dependent protease